jgi:hypothetical protein
MNGHIIEVEETTSVLWFRLNDTNVSKNRCKLVEIYKDLDLQFIEQETYRITQFNDETVMQVQGLNRYRSFVDSIGRLPTDKTLVNSPFVPQIQMDHIQLVDSLAHMQAQVDERKRQSIRDRDNFLQYMSDRCTRVS